MSDAGTTKNLSKSRKLEARRESVGSIEEYLKRKRKETRVEQEQAELFAKSSKTLRSPDKPETHLKPEESTEMEELKQIMISMSNELKNEIKNSCDQLKKTNEEIKSLREEMKRREEEWRKERELWSCEKKNLLDRVKKMEDKLERQEKNDKKNNIIIKGLDTEQRDIKEVTQEFVKKELNVEPKIREAYTVGKRRLIVVKLEDFHTKLAIMKKKSKLGDKKVYIENDLTQREVSIQATIRAHARDERAKGNVARVGFQKLSINGQWYKWDHTENKLKIDPKN